MGVLFHLNKGMRKWWWIGGVKRTHACTCTHTHTFTYTHTHTHTHKHTHRHTQINTHTHSIHCSTDKVKVLS